MEPTHRSGTDREPRRAAGSYSSAWRRQAQRKIRTTGSRRGNQSGEQSARLASTASREVKRAGVAGATLTEDHVPETGIGDHVTSGIFDLRDEVSARVVGV